MSAVTPNEKTIAQQLSKFIVGLTYADLPANVVARTKDLVLDQLGCQLLGSTMSWCQVVGDFARDYPGEPRATVVNGGFKTWAHDAALVNATFGHGCELDDHVDVGGGHPGPMTVPAALALGEEAGLSGQDVIVAIVAGYDVAWRLGRTLTPKITKGFHSQSILGGMVGAAVAGKLIGLDADQLAHAFSIAASHAGGLQEYDQSGGSVKRLHAGLPARAGIHSAILARGGMTGPLTIFEGKHGVVRSFAKHGDPDPNLILGGFGADWGVLHVEIKSYPAVISQQSPIALFEDLIAEHDLSPGDVQEIRVGMKSEMSAGHVGSIREPHDPLSAQFSLPFSLALRLIKRNNDLEMYIDPAMWRDPDLLNVSKEKVQIEVDPRLADLEDGSGCYLTVTLTDGRVLKKDERYQKGHAKNPHTLEELIDKFNRLAASVLSPEQSKEFVETVKRLEQLSDVTELMSLVA